MSKAHLATLAAVALKLASFEAEDFLQERKKFSIYLKNFDIIATFSLYLYKFSAFSP